MIVCYICCADAYDQGPETMGDRLMTNMNYWNYRINLDGKLRRVCDACAGLFCAGYSAAELFRNHVIACAFCRSLIPELAS